VILERRRTIPTSVLCRSTTGPCPADRRRRRAQFDRAPFAYADFQTLSLKLKPQRRRDVGWLDRLDPVDHRKS